MTQLSISLPDPLTAYIQEQITAGQYDSPSDYIQTLIQQDQFRRTQLEESALAGLNSGSATPMTGEDWDNIRAAVRKNLGVIGDHA
jgi:antitoxin ParD1/3/4